MSKTLTEIAQQLRDSPKKVQLIYAFNGTGKTRLSREFKELIAPKDAGGGNGGDGELSHKKILYYNAFTEDLFYWDNDLEADAEPKLKIQPNTFTDWVLRARGDTDIVKNFQRYTNDKLMPLFHENDVIRAGKKTGEKTYPEVTFSFETGAESSGNLKISKGEESSFIWSIFYSLIKQVVEVLDVAEPEDRETDQFNQLEYIFIDDPVSSLDENHLIELAVDLAQLIKSNTSDVKFIITTHNPLFFNVLYHEFNNAEKYRLGKDENGTFQLVELKKDSPFSYHLYLKAELEKAVQTGQLKKYHFNFLRNILEKTATFLGYESWGALLPKTKDGTSTPYEARIINISSHSKHAGEEVAGLSDDDKRVLTYLVTQLNKMYRFDSPLIGDLTHD